jgi:CBS domain-containing protein
MAELVVGAIMTRNPVAVRPGTLFKDVVCALLAGDVCAVPVTDAGRKLVGIVAEGDILANLEFHGGLDPAPILRTGDARRRWRRAAATTAAELMADAPCVIRVDACTDRAARALAHSPHHLLCVVDDELRLVGVVTARNLLTLYQRSDDSIAAELTALLTAQQGRPARTPPDITISVSHGVVVLAGSLTYRSRVEQAGLVTSHVAGVVAVHNHLTYEVDDMLVTGF